MQISNSDHTAAGSWRLWRFWHLAETFAFQRRIQRPALTCTRIRGLAASHGQISECHKVPVHALLSTAEAVARIPFTIVENVLAEDFEVFRRFSWWLSRCDMDPWQPGTAHQKLQGISKPIARLFAALYRTNRRRLSIASLAAL